MDMDLYDKTIICPVCNNTFKTKRVKSSKVKVKKIHPDFYTEYNGENPNYYSINVCPHCGFSGFEKEFEKISPLSRERVIEKISANWKSRDFGQCRTIDQAIESYKLAFLSCSLTGCGNSTLAKITLRLMWLSRELGDKESESRYRNSSLNYFIKSYEEDRFDEETKSELLQIMFMIAELSRQCELYQDAIKWFSLLVKDPDIKKARHLEIRAKDLWAETSATYRSKGGVIDETE